MAIKNAVSTYREIRINTASQGQLIIILYSEAVRQLDYALHLLELNETKKDPGRIEKISKCVLKAQEIVSELMVSLDFEQGGDIANNLFSLYTWFNRELMEANISQDPHKVGNVRDHLEALRIAWQEIAATVVTDNASVEVLGVNIAG